MWDVVSDRFAYNHGEILREYVDHTGAVAVLACDEQDRVLLIKQYRHPIGLRDWEIPAGLLDIRDETPLACAQRELAEEADLAADRWHLLTEFFSSPGGSNEAIRVYLARGLSTTETFGRSRGRGRHRDPLGRLGRGGVRGASAPLHQRDPRERRAGRLRLPRPRLVRPRRRRHPVAAASDTAILTR